MGHTSAPPRDSAGLRATERSLLITLSLAVVFAVGGLLKEGEGRATPAGPELARALALR